MAFNIHTITQNLTLQYTISEPRLKMLNEVFPALGEVTLEGDIAQIHFVDSMVTTGASITAILYSKESSKKPFFFLQVKHFLSWNFQGWKCMY